MKYLKHLERKKVVWLAVLLSCVFLLTAFRFEQQNNLLTRMDLALLIESVLENTRVNARIDSLPDFNDLDEDRVLSIYRCASLKIMSGFPDGSFRPDEPLRNLETVCYLQKLAKFLRKNHPESHAARQLMRIFAYQNQPERILATGLPAGSFPPELADAGGMVGRQIVSNLVYALIEGQNSQQHVLNGRVVNAVTGQPLAEAYIAGGRKAVVTDDNGNFTMDFTDLENPEVVLFAASEDYQPVEIRKDLRISSHITFRLRPEKKAGRKVLASRPSAD